MLKNNKTQYNYFCEKCESMNPQAILQFASNQLKKPSDNPFDALKKICEYLRNNLDHYDWVGFYFHHKEKPKLVLKAYAGEPTEHQEIPFGKGICGQVAETDTFFRVDNVNNQENYIACSIHTKSELVVPIFVNAKNVGQIDIDSHQQNAFTSKDEKMLEKLNQLIAEYIKQNDLSA